MHTDHCFHFKDARDMRALAADTIDLVVTSPPYPMIAMWDDLFTRRDPVVAKALKDGNGPLAFARMHGKLDDIWSEIRRVVKPGAFVCINIGDATRSLGGHFALYANHARIQTRMQDLGFTALPVILWRKQTNAPNKFMGSGMLPAGAYVTLEHEYILIFRKGPKREFNTEPDKENRRQSALFWEERNTWFSDIWFDLKGARQSLDDRQARKRSAAFPFEVAYRLISMFSVKGDRVLDPFAGTATTAAAAVSAGRNSVGYEIEPDFKAPVVSRMQTVCEVGNARICERLARHVEFVAARQREKGALRYNNTHYGFPVVTRQETQLLLGKVLGAAWLSERHLEAEHAETPQTSFCRDWQELFSVRGACAAPGKNGPQRGRGQRKLPL